MKLQNNLSKNYNAKGTVHITVHIHKTLRTSGFLYSWPFSQVTTVYVHTHSEKKLEYKNWIE